MVRFLVCLSALFAAASAAPSGYYGPHAYVGHETVQVGSKQVLAGHQYVQGPSSFEQPPPYSYAAGPAKNSAETIPLAPPAIPAPTETFFAPVVEASVQTYRNDNAAGRRNIVITPQQTIVKPVVEVNEVPYDVPVHVPVPVERKVLVEKVVAKPVPVEVLVHVPVAKPYEVRPVQTVVKTPVVHQQTVSHHYNHGPAYGHAGYAGYTGAYPTAGYAGAYPTAGYAGAYHAAAPAHALTKHSVFQKRLLQAQTQQNCSNQTLNEPTSDRSTGFVSTYNQKLRSIRVPPIDLSTIAE
ncbi:unnamed protein product [Lepeophtheirus salmonis]|uniref:(salmon louse) hypothetical protein n=1 Tax=Lepeophtheirus salmonis TaxID=72036 RepID=A0A7R8H2H8_LEPSM|nr:unnamed protein product [Lepeophtheirus salmonis]CAF2826967.1 unnamed protein product [Lepeophtheirus salmonis]